MIDKLDWLCIQKLVIGDQMTQLSQAIQIGVEQLHNNQHIDGPASREKMKRKIDAIVKAK